MKNLNRIAFLTCIVCVLAVGVAQAGDWQKIGKQTLLFNTDSDVINVKKTDMACSQIMFKISKKAINITDVTIVFDDGTDQKATLNENIRPGFESSVIEINGGAKKIVKVEFGYAPTNGQKNGRSFVTLVATA
ncbi:MAG: hypothetical protein K8R59_03090 [Thermoanaerobaculales bacterium]|nr:hypothetical protein [Thermoanaerobaculales bacterium]